MSKQLVSLSLTRVHAVCLPADAHLKEIDTNYSSGDSQWLVVKSQWFEFNRGLMLT